jgi:putative thioredoxin
MNSDSKDSIRSVSSLSMRVDESSIREYLELSDQLPVLVLLVSESDSASKELESTISRVVDSKQGKTILLIIDVDLSPALAQAFEVQQVPALLALLKGQPAPLFTGNQPKDQVELVVNRVLEVALENGLDGQVQVAAEETNQPIPEPLSETLTEAYRAMEETQFEKALPLFEKALLENPSDQLAEAGLAQVKLLLRIEGKNLSEVLQTQTATQLNVFERVDALVASGNPDQAFKELLDFFETSPTEERDPIRLRLLELFLVVGTDSESVASARRRLSLLLF